MTLTLSDGSVAEAHRILDASSHAEVLQLDIRDTSITPDAVRKQFDTIKKVLFTRHSFGIDSVTRAKQRLEQAFNALSSAPLIERERAAAVKRAETLQKDIYDFREIASMTVELEARVAA